MCEMIPGYLDRLYAGWLGKVIGIRLGAPIEGFTSDRIDYLYGLLHDYPVDYKLFAADDDSNGPFFFLRALEDCGDPRNMTSQDVAEALMNYAPWEHGFFWWGGYGVSTEHTAYLNLRSGIPAPQSGSIRQNGATVAEQIGGQIFVDSWGLVAPGNPSLAADLARRASQVTHDGNAVYGGMFIAGCISLAFIRDDIHAIVDEALGLIPEDCEYARVARDVMAFYKKQPDDWRACLRYVQAHYGYDKYPGACHVIPNGAIVVLSLLYGEGDYSKTICICSTCGWDTDCNAGNVGAILGVLVGTAGIESKWRKPINDFLACSSVVGSLNLLDIPFCATYTARLACALGAAQPTESPVFDGPADACHFEYAGSTHAMRACAVDDGELGWRCECNVENSAERAHTGLRSLKLTAKSPLAGKPVRCFRKTYYYADEFHDSRYDPSFSPTFVPGETLHASVLIPDFSPACSARAYVKLRGGEVITGETALCEKERWHELQLQVPRVEGGLIEEAGVEIIPQIESLGESAIAYIDDLFFDGKPDYSVDFACETLERWSRPHTEISQMTILKGIKYLEDGCLHLTCSDRAEMYTGKHSWTDVSVDCDMRAQTGEKHFLLARVQGAERNYAFGFDGKGAVSLEKNHFGYTTLQTASFDWQPDREYRLSMQLNGAHIRCFINGDEVLAFTDEEQPYLHGAIGVGVRDGSHIAVRRLDIH